MHNVRFHRSVSCDRIGYKLTREELDSLQSVGTNNLVWVEIGVTGAGKGLWGTFYKG